MRCDIDDSGHGRIVGRRLTSTICAVLRGVLVCRVCPQPRCMCIAGTASRHAVRSRVPRRDAFVGRATRRRSHERCLHCIYFHDTCLHDTCLHDACLPDIRTHDFSPLLCRRSNVPHLHCPSAQHNVGDQCPHQPLTARADTPDSMTPFTPSRCSCTVARSPSTTTAITSPFTPRAVKR